MSKCYYLLHHRPGPHAEHNEDMSDSPDYMSQEQEESMQKSRRFSLVKIKET